jgi:riboflavin kinase / FMN adenylyltransferase
MTYPVFSAHVITGSGRGKKIGTPTVNIDLNDVPSEIAEGIYAGWAKLEGKWQMAAIHYGPRPVFNDIPSFELYLLDIVIDTDPTTIDVLLVQRLRDVLDFPSKDDLMAQIGEDVRQTRGILETHGSPDA